MLNARLTAARRIADELFPSEADIETAIASTSRLIGAIVEGRAETRMPIAMGQESLAALNGTMTALIAARATIAEAHAALAKDRISAGLSAYGMGDVGECPPVAGRLKVVDEQQQAA